MAANAFVKPRRRIQVPKGTVQRIPLNSGIRTTRITVGGRATGNITVLVKPYLTVDEIAGDEGKNAYINYPLAEFEAIANGTIDLSSNSKTRFFNLELAAILIDDSANASASGDIWVEVHQV
jgi:hypothetical protein